jgi:1-acyl-sn-glycerol-3-phosphate acyltransferase
MRFCMKIIGIVPLLLAYLLISCSIAFLPAGSRLRRILHTKNTSFFSRMMLSLLGVNVHIEHEGLTTLRSGSLIVSNHTSYIDILVIASLTPAVFITSVELGSTLFLGMLARFGGSLFVERRKPFGLKREIAMIARAIAEGFTVVLFPEGTTSNGERIQPFKKSLFDAAVMAGVDIRPICLRYTKINGGALTVHNRGCVFYYGGDTFFRHFPKFSLLKSVDVVVIPLKSIKVPEHASRKELALAAHAAISSAYDNPLNV